MTTSRDLLATDIGSISATAPKSSSSGPCPSVGIASGISILKFGKSLPLLELFETFMIVGLVIVVVTASTYFTFNHISNILKNEGASPAAVNMASAAANSQPVWIIVGVAFFLVGVVLYYLHRRIVSAPS